MIRPRTDPDQPQRPDDPDEIQARLTDARDAARTPQPAEEQVRQLLGWCDLAEQRGDGRLHASTIRLALAAVLPDGDARVTRTPQPAEDRCPSCEHRREFHSEPGCWYAVTSGTPGKALNCPCTLVDWTAPPSAKVGRCGHPLTMFGRTSLCALPADHRGWHRDGATEWSDGSHPTASQPAVTDGNDASPADAPAKAWVVLPDDEVAAQIDLIANALAEAGLRYSAKDLRHVARDLRQSGPEVRAAAAAALALAASPAAPEEPAELPPCSACTRPIDPTERHVVLLQQVEQHDPPGRIHVRDTTVLTTRHEECAS